MAAAGPVARCVEELAMDISELRSGDNHYMAYVGPLKQYDFMGATQFRLLCTLGLRANHHILDFGCGSLRAGRLFITYLDESRYFGIEPNRWLIEDAVNNQLGKDLLDIKKPRFHHNSDFVTNVFSQQFDFIIAQSIFSHAGRDLIASSLKNFRDSLKPDGLIAVTFIEGIEDFDDSGWVYPDCVRYRRPTIKRFAEEAGLFITRIPWYHPRQTWYLLARDNNRLPNRPMKRHLSGAVLFDPEFTVSWNTRDKIVRGSREFIRERINRVPQPIKTALRRIATVPPSG